MIRRRSISFYVYLSQSNFKREMNDTTKYGMDRAATYLFSARQRYQRNYMYI